MKKSRFLFFGLFVLIACTNEPAHNVIEINGLDSSIKPGDNFFLYVNKKWEDTVQIPPSQSGVGAYMFMNYPQRLRLQGILDSVSKATNEDGSIAQKIGDFYASGMDTNTINSRGYDPLKPILSRIENIHDISSMMKFVAEEAGHYNTSIIAFGIGPGNTNSSMNIAHVYQTVQNQKWPPE